MSEPSAAEVATLSADKKKSIQIGANLAMFDPMRLKRSLQSRMHFTAIAAVVPALIALAIVGYTSLHGSETDSFIFGSVIAAAALLGLVSLFTNLTTLRKMFDSLGQIQSAANSMAAGKLEIELDTNTEDEMTALKEALIGLASQTKNYCREIENQNQDLERLIGKKTKRLEQMNMALAFQNEKVSDATRLKDEFLANVSHELRTPLNGILALSEMLNDEMSGPMNDEQKKQVSMITKSGENLLNLINQVLDLSKIEGRQVDLNYTKGTVVKHLIAAGNRLRPLAEEKGLVFKIEADQPDLELIQDQDKLRQIFVNLIGNAIKFTKSGVITAQIRVIEAENLLQVSVQDTGPGIPEDMCQQVFQEFRQLEGADGGKNQGTGLGLAISRRLVQMLGGDIWVESTLGIGSLFTLVVPLNGVGQTLEEDLPDSDEMETESDNSRSLALPEYRSKVLVVDDDIVNSGVLSRYLKQDQLDVTVAASGAQAIKSLHDKRIDLVVLDLIESEGMDFSILTEIKKNSANGDVPIIVNTSRHLETDELESLEMGSQAIFQRDGRSTKELVTLVRAVLEENETNAQVDPINNRLKRVA